MKGTKRELFISPTVGAIDPPPIMIKIKEGRHAITELYVRPEDFALALTGRMVHGFTDYEDAK